MKRFSLEDLVFPNDPFYKGYKAKVKSRVNLAMPRYTNAKLYIIAHLQAVLLEDKIEIPRKRLSEDFCLQANLKKLNDLRAELGLPAPPSNVEHYINFAKAYSEANRIRLPQNCCERAKAFYEQNKEFFKHKKPSKVAAICLLESGLNENQLRDIFRVSRQTYKKYCSESYA